MAIYNDYQHTPVWKRPLNYHDRHLRVLKLQVYYLIGPAMASLMLGVWETLGFEETSNHLHLDCVLPDNTDIWPCDSGRDELEDSGDGRCVYSVCACTSGDGPVLIAKSISRLWVFAPNGDEGLEDSRP